MMGPVNHVVNLDELARRLTRLRPEWELSAQVGPFSWRDAEAAWPQPIETERSLVKVPESLGVRLTSGDDEAEIVVGTGGWADIGFLLGEEVTDLYAEFRDVDAAYAAVARNIEDFLA
jgi:hypothetical protein